MKTPCDERPHPMNAYPDTWPSTITEDHLAALVYTAAGGWQLLSDLHRTTQATIRHLIADCDNEARVVVDGVVIEPWSPAEQREHRDQLAAAIDHPLHVRDRIAAARRGPEDPEVDWAAVERYCGGPATTRLTAAEKFEVFLYLQQKMTRRDIMGRLRVSSRTYGRWLDRAAQLTAAA